jgi:hypothetical protein
MEYKFERFFNNIKGTCLGAGYQFYDDILKDLIYKMENKIGHPLIRNRYYHNIRFVMNLPFYHEFSTVCKMSGHDPEMYRDNIKIILDYGLDVGDPLSPSGIVRLVYEEPEVKCNHHHYGYNTKQIYYDDFFGLQRVPHIDHVKFNGPATIVFWKDGTKTVVKHDGKGRKDKRQAILYAFIRKIYGEGKPYHYILNEIEEAVK